MNLPREELESVERICFQVEEAQWFYEDFVRPLDPNLPSLNLKQFCLKIFQHCPLFSDYDEALYTKAFSEFLAYKTRVPVRGAILLDETMTQVILVKGWKKGANWSFPRGKINKDEKDIDCAIREVYEETGYDVRDAGLVGREEDAKFIEVTMREQHMKLFVFAGVPTDTHFEPRTRKEISKIKWYKLSDLPTLKKAKQQQHEGQEPSINANKFYMVAPFLRPLKNIISQRRKQNVTNSHISSQKTLATMPAALELQEAARDKAVGESGLVGDMSRLMAQLRQSKQASRENNFPEVSEPVEAVGDASAHMKKSFPSPLIGPSLRPAERDSAAARETKASAMLALLRSGGSTSSTQPSQQEPPPQTPFEQISGQPFRPPPSAKHHTARPSCEPCFPPPPPFPFSPSQVGNQTTAHRPLPMFQQPTNSLLNQFLPQQHLRPQPIPQARSQPPRFPQVSAPYQRTGDPEFAQLPPHTAPGSSLIPPASRLPPPKLNSHASTLLSLFKSKDFLEPAPSAVPSLPIKDDDQRLELSASSPLTLKNPQSSFFGDTGPAQPHGISPGPESSSTLTPREFPKRSSQQEALLGLFKSAVSTSKTSSSLSPPTTAIELSATQSPTHLRASSALNLAEDKVSASKPLVNGHVTIQKRPSRSPISKQAGVSATVTGPLNVPQFDQITKKSSLQKDHVDNGTTETGSHSPKPQQSIKILSRPSTANKPNKDSHVTESVSPNPPRTRESTRRSKKSAESKDSLKPFQPQILKRPVEDPPPAPKDPPSHPVPTLITRDSFLRDGRSSQTQEQKSVLLSLFGKPSPMVPVAATFNESLVSPLSAKPPTSSSIPSPVGTMARSRIGSLTSLTEDGLMSGSQTPKATASPVDKKFLLGFLDGVAKEGRR